MRNVLSCETAGFYMKSKILFHIKCQPIVHSLVVPHMKIQHAQLTATGCLISVSLSSLRVPDEWATTKCDIAHIFLQQTLETQVGSPAVLLRLACCTSCAKQWIEAMEFLQASSQKL